MAQQPSIVGLLLRCLVTALLLQPIHASVEANSAYEFAKLIQQNVAGAAQVIHVQHYTVAAPSGSVLKEMETDNRCSCRRVCDAINPACSVMSYDPDTRSCSLADAIERATPTPGATYTYLMPASSRITKQVDGLYYYLDLTQTKSFDSAQTACYQRGFRLAISRSATTAEVFKGFHDANPTEQIWINLEKGSGTGASTLRWGDGSVVDSASISSMPLTLDGYTSVWGGNRAASDPLAFMINTQGKLNDYPPNRSLSFLCQANFDLMAW